MHEALLRLTRPEDSLLWWWVAIAAAHAVAGVVLGLRARRSRSLTGPPEPLAPPAAFG